ncbi:MAG: ornithine cyclodeaminase family protein [Actinomycetia bacterium]|nr:ornithine cyclodeaminase family protein [Actinomycetes bacterium]
MAVAPTRLIAVDAAQVRATVSMGAAIGAVRQAFLDLAAGAFEMPDRTQLDQGRFLAMMVRHRPSNTAAFKALSVNLENRVPAIVGAVVLADLARASQLVADAAAVTALRTGAATGAATDLLAPPDARRLVMIGAGAQAPDQVRAVCAVRPIDEVVVVDLDPARAGQLAQALADELPGVRVETGADAADAVAGADVVCCATTARQALFEPDALPARVHVNAIGAYRPAMRELPVGLLGGGLVVVDQRAAALTEAGDIIDGVEQGALRPDDLLELGDALAAPPARTPRTVFKSVGLAIQDWAVAKLLADALLD